MRHACGEPAKNVADCDAMVSKLEAQGVTVMFPPSDFARHRTRWSFVRDTYGMDAVRYFLLREMAFGSDADFTEAALITRINADLANGLGNLASRTLAMMQKYFAGAVQPMIMVVRALAIARMPSSAL
jgi:valyl-tRNA synthetase